MHPLVLQGYEALQRFCALNVLPEPDVLVHESGAPEFGACGYFQPPKDLHVYPHLCSKIGTGGRRWSCPGYSTDRTPFGVILHEFGHYIDTVLTRKLRQRVSTLVRARSGRESPLTSYAPNGAEWFAEMFRLYVSNPDLLERVRPATCAELDALLFRAEQREWRAVLQGYGAPDRTILAAERKIAALNPKKVGPYLVEWQGIALLARNSGKNEL